MAAWPNPNVLLISTDHWPAALLGVAGHPVIQTPTLDSLARSGTRFTNAYAECPVCIPARRTLMPGTMPKTHDDRVFKEKLVMPAIRLLRRGNSTFILKGIGSASTMLFWMRKGVPSMVSSMIMKSFSPIGGMQGNNFTTE